MCPHKIFYSVLPDLSHCLIDTGRYPFFLTGLLMVMGSGFFILILNTIVSGPIEERDLLSNRWVYFIWRRLS